VHEQDALGFDESTGLRRNLRKAGNAVERIINENMTWLSPLTSFPRKRIPPNSASLPPPKTSAQRKFGRGAGRLDR